MVEEAPVVEVGFVEDLFLVEEAFGEAVVEEVLLEVVFE